MSCFCGMERSFRATSPPCGPSPGRRDTADAQEIFFRSLRAGPLSAAPASTRAEMKG